MRIRVVISGIVGGMVVSLVSILFSSILENLDRGIRTVPTSESPSWINLFGVGVPYLLVFVCGWIAARWNWSRTWNAAFLSGAGSGLIAGALYFYFSGVTFNATDSQITFLARVGTGAHVAEFETIFTTLFRSVIDTLLFPEGYDSVEYFNSIGDISLLSQFVQSVSLPSQFCFASLSGGAFCGALGGLASVLVDRDDVWGSSVPAYDPWLFRLSAYFLILNGLLVTLITVSVATLLDGAIVQWAKDVNWGLSKPPSWLDIFFWIHFLVVSAISGIFTTLTPSLMSIALGRAVDLVEILFALTWGWTLRDWILERKRSILSGLWTLLTLASMFYWIVNDALSKPSNILGEINDFGVFVPFRGEMIDVFPLFQILAHLFVLGVAVLIGWNIKRTPETEWVSYRFGDRLGYLLTCAILGGVQMMTGIVIYAIPIILIIITGDMHFRDMDAKLLSTIQEQIFLLRDNRIMFLLITTGVIFSVIVINLILALLFLWVTVFFETCSDLERGFLAFRTLRDISERA